MYVVSLNGKASMYSEDKATEWRKGYCTRASTHMRTHTHAHAHTRTHSRTRTHMYVCARACILVRTCRYLKELLLSAWSVKHRCDPKGSGPQCNIDGKYSGGVASPHLTDTPLQVPTQTLPH